MTGVGIARRWHRHGLLYPFLLIFKTFVTKPKPGKVTKKINSYFAADDIGHQLYSIAFSQIWCMCSYPAMLGFLRRTVKRSEIPGRSQRAVRSFLRNWSSYFQKINLQRSGQSPRAVRLFRRRTWVLRRAPVTCCMDYCAGISTSVHLALSERKWHQPAV